MQKNFFMSPRSGFRMTFPIFQNKNGTGIQLKLKKQF